ncbi:uncharacterized protein EV154DRAFT_488153 [Mucor mucedo]|uniref:uncharacterized protein n=1 Tax=Mucor mucedo TaxID=29922 RepID=UPI00221F8FB0|nr:uncharacterized protein EV154DRAFT_488153 [Mucor mucedo]KAI7868379.1 hypothetical protein EV154DRAFT_488153 [Mucor mucedo]
MQFSCPNYNRDPNERHLTTPCFQVLAGICKVIFRFRSKGVPLSERVDRPIENSFYFNRVIRTEYTVNEQQRMPIVKLEEKLKQMGSTSETGYKSADKVDIFCWTIKDTKRIKWIKESG